MTRGSTAGAVEHTLPSKTLESRPQTQQRHVTRDKLAATCLTAGLPDEWRRRRQWAAHTCRCSRSSRRTARAPNARSASCHSASTRCSAEVVRSSGSGMWARRPFSLRVPHAPRGDVLRGGEPQVPNVPRGEVTGGRAFRSVPAVFSHSVRFKRPKTGDFATPIPPLSGSPRDCRL